MSLIGPMFPEGLDLPTAYDGCTCSCHRHAGVMHCVPCCYPGRTSVLGKVYEDGEVYRRRYRQSDIDSDIELLLSERKSDDAGTEFGDTDGVNFDKRKD